MSEVSAPDTSRLSILQERISIVTWFVTLLLSLRGILEFYGTKVKGNFELSLNFITEPFVRLFQFKSLENIDIPAITVLFSAISFLLLSCCVQLAIRYYMDIRYARTRDALVKQAIFSSTKYSTK
jgi:hypothetical protein